MKGPLLTLLLMKSLAKTTAAQFSKRWNLPLQAEEQLEKMLEGIFPEWRSLDSVPKEGSFLVLLETADKTMGSRVAVAMFHPNVKFINGKFAFDMPKPVGWLPLSALPSIPDDPRIVKNK